MLAVAFSADAFAQQGSKLIRPWVPSARGRSPLARSRSPLPSTLFVVVGEGGRGASLELHAKTTQDMCQSATCPVGVNFGSASNDFRKGKCNTVFGREPRPT